MTQSSFTATVSAWVRKSEKRMIAVFKESAQQVGLEVKGKTPVDTGFLRASLLASTSSMPLIDRETRPEKNAVIADNNAEIALVIAGASLGDTIYFGFTAAYARRIEYGFSGEDSLGRKYNQTGVGMVRLTAQRWPDIVREVAAKAKARYP